MKTFRVVVRAVGVLDFADEQISVEVTPDSSNSPTPAKTNHQAANATARLVKTVRDRSRREARFRRSIIADMRLYEPIEVSN